MDRSTAARRLEAALAPAPTPGARAGRGRLVDLLAGLAAGDPDRAGRLAQQVLFEAPEGAGPAAAVLARALGTGVVWIDYEDAKGEQTRRALEPLAFVDDGLGTYVVGWCRLREEPRAFRLDRVRRAVAVEAAEVGAGWC